MWLISFFLFVDDDLKSFTYPKSKIKDEFLFFCLNSFWNIWKFFEYKTGLKVKSLFSDRTWKYGTLIDEPKTFELLTFGSKKPDCLSTVGSGWKNLGK